GRVERRAGSARSDKGAFGIDDSLDAGQRSTEGDGDGQGIGRGVVGRGGRAVAAARGNPSLSPEVSGVEGRCAAGCRGGGKASQGADGVGSFGNRLVEGDVHGDDTGSIGRGSGTVAAASGDSRIRIIV